MGPAKLCAQHRADYQTAQHSQPSMTSPPYKKTWPTTGDQRPCHA